MAVSKAIPGNVGEKDAYMNDDGNSDMDRQREFTHEHP